MWHMLAKMTARSALIIVMVLACWDGSYAGEVPTRFLGYWSGIARLKGSRYIMSMLVTGGSTNTTVGMIYTLWSDADNCIQEIRFTNGEDGGAIETVTDKILFDEDVCFSMKIVISPSRADRIVVDWKQLDVDGDIIETSSSVMDRSDIGQFTKRMGTCKPKTDTSPLAKLKKKLDEDKKSKKKRG